MDKSQIANDLLDNLLPNKMTNDANASINNNSGQYSVFISYETDNDTAELRLGSDVSAPLADEDIKQLKKALGEDRVYLIH